MLLRHPGFRRLCQARERLLALDDETLTIEALARDAQLSTSHFIRQFEAVFGVTPHQLRIRARLDAAKQLLTTSSLTVTDVCMEVGFSSLGSFSDLFRRRLGEPPSVYQRRVRPLVSVTGRLPLSLAPGCLTLMAALPITAFRKFGEADPS